MKLDALLFSRLVIGFLGGTRAEVETELDLEHVRLILRCLVDSGRIFSLPVP
jgi:hypothetical protein